MWSDPGLLARLEAEQVAGWATVTPVAPPPPRVVVVASSRGLSAADLRQRGHDARRKAEARMVTQERGDRRTREFMSDAYTYESRARTARSSSYPGLPR